MKINSSLGRYGLILALSFLLSSFIWAQSVYDFNQNSDIAVGLFTNGGTNTFDILEETSLLTSTNRTHTIYVPVYGNSGSIDNSNFSYFANSIALPLFSAGSSADGENYLQFNLNIDVVGDVKYLNVAISADSGATTFEGIGSIEFSPFSSGNHLIQIDFNDICNYTSGSSSLFDCEIFNSGNTPADDAEFTLFFYLANGNHGDGASIEKSSYNGVIYRVKMSNRVYSTNFPRMLRMSKGDGQLITEVDGFTINDDFDSWYAAIDSTSCTNDSELDPIRTFSLTRENLRDLDITRTDGEIKIGELTNGTCYSIRLFQCDKFGFCSNGTEQLAETPENIEVLLEEQSCFFFTAGFGREHYVVNFFQYWRDTFLKRFWLGKKFIQWYYKTAPQYTGYILKTPWLQKMIQGVGYALYGLIKWWWISLTALIFLSSLTIIQFRRLRF
jgi:hypothetical protein